MTSRYWIQRKLKKKEPALKATKALFSPSTGIVDVHELMTALEGDFEAHGGHVVLNTPVERIEPLYTRHIVWTGGADAIGIKARFVINAAGLGAQSVARETIGLSADHIPPLFYGKGNYFTVSGKPPFKHLVYPVPMKGGLGIHSTLDAAGRVRFGPDVERVDTLDYTVNESAKERFIARISRYWPDVRTRELLPDFAGIRPKTGWPGGQDDDFIFSGPGDHHIRGLLNLFGFESPGLTSCLAIAEHVCTIVQEWPRHP